MMKYLSILAITLVLTFSAPQQDLVNIVIPGYTKHNIYSGMLDFSTGSFHYVFFDSQRDPDNDPVVLWLNGGPGCSSLLGMVYQNGPFVFQQGTVNFEINRYAWNLKANLLYITSPGGVGFSTSKRGTSKNDDGTVAVDNYRALLAFYQKFPNLKKNDFYITGQSYAGIYIPYLSQEIIRNNKLPNTQTKIKLVGIMINNACTDPRECYEPGNDINMGIYQYENLFNHGFYTESQYNMVTGACTLGYSSAGCKAIRKELDARFYNTNTSMLNLYAKCLFQKVDGSPQKIMLPNGRKTLTMADGYICQDMFGISHYFNDAVNQLNWHVPFTRFQACSDAVATNYTMFANASYWLYPILIKQQLRIMILSGDVDNSVPVTGTVRWLNKFKDQFGVPVDEPWREWWVPGLHKHEDQVGGMVWKLRGLTYASVKGAGHMMPKDKRKQAFVLLDSFLNNVDLPDNPDLPDM